jgi:hypothetical protein
LAGVFFGGGFGRALAEQAAALQQRLDEIY